jgi:hypothetical protein
MGTHFKKTNDPIVRRRQERYLEALETRPTLAEVARRRREVTPFLPGAADGTAVEVLCRGCAHVDLYPPATSQPAFAVCHACGYRETPFPTTKTAPR